MIVDGTWGFASHADLDPRARRRDRRAGRRGGRAPWPRSRRAGRAGRRARVRRRQLGVRLPHRPVRRARPPTRSACSTSTRAGCSPPTASTTCRPSLHAVKEQTFYADTAGSSITQQRVRVQPPLEAVAVDAAAGTFETDAHARAADGRGWEDVDRRRGWDWTAELAQLPELLAEKVKAPSVIAGPNDLVIDPSNLWLTIHESIGHATEYDRAIGYEAAYAGTSFATPDKLGTMRYGSPVMNVTADRTDRLRAGHRRLRRRGRAGTALGSGARRHLRRLPARPGVRAAAGLAALQRLLVRRLAAPRADPADGQRVAAARPRRTSAPTT